MGTYSPAEEFARDIAPHLIGWTVEAVEGGWPGTGDGQLTFRLSKGGERKTVAIGVNDMGAWMDCPCAHGHGWANGVRGWMCRGLEDHPELRGASR